MCWNTRRCLTRRNRGGSSCGIFISGIFISVPSRDAGAVRGGVHAGDPGQKHGAVVLLRLFYAYGGVSYLGLLLLSVLVNWAAGLWLSRLEDGRGRRAVFLAGLAYNIGILVIFKYLNLFGDTAAWIAGKLSGHAVESIIPAIALPIGISFSPFRSCPI